MKTRHAPNTRRSAPPPKKTHREPTVTDHALLRWLERVYGLDTEALRAQILTPGLRSAIRGGAASATVDGFVYIFEGGCLKTVFAKERLPPRYRERDEDDHEDA